MSQSGDKGQKRTGELGANKARVYEAVLEPTVPDLGTGPGIQSGQERVELPRTVE